MHKNAYGLSLKRALALLPVGIEAFSACEIAKCIRICIRIFADFRRNRPPMKLIRLCSSSSPASAWAVFCLWKRFFGPSDGLSSFRRMGLLCHPIRAAPQGAPRIRFPGNDVD